MKDIDALLKKSQEKSVEVDIEIFKSALSQVDSQMKNLPPTAQVYQLESSSLTYEKFLLNKSKTSRRFWWWLLNFYISR